MVSMDKLKQNSLYKTSEVAIRNRTNLRLVLYSLAIFAVLLGGMLMAIQTTLEVRILAVANSSQREVNIPFEDPVDGDGWNRPENGTIWTSSETATINMNVDSGWYEIDFFAQGILPSILDTLTLKANGQPVSLTSQKRNDGWTHFEGRFGPDVFTTNSDALTLTFESSQVLSPMSIGANEDPRLLGIRLDWIEIQPVIQPPVQSPELFLSIFFASIAGAILSLNLRIRLPRLKVTRLLFRVLIVTIVLLAIMFRLFLPQMSLVQTGSFIGWGILISLVVMIWAPTPVVYGKDTTIADHLTALWKNRTLLRIWVRYNVTSRYSQAFLGVFWVILQPLALSFVLAFVFSIIIRGVDTGGAPYIAFLLSGVVPFQFFNQGISKGAASLRGASSVMQKVYFPREIIVLVKLGEAVVDTTFMFIAMIFISIIVGLYPTPTILFLPFIMLIEFGFVLGFVLFLSYLSMMFSDIPELISIVMRFLFYITPIIYPSSMIPARFGGIGVFNPLTSLIDAYRDILLYNTPPDLTTLYYPIVLASLMTYVGYLSFKQHEKRLVDYI